MAYNHPKKIVLKSVKNKKDSYKMEKGLSMYQREITFSDKEIPEAKDWPVGEKYTLQIEVQLTSRTDNVGEEPENRFQVLKVGNVENKYKK